MILNNFIIHFIVVDLLLYCNINFNMSYTPVALIVSTLMAREIIVLSNGETEETQGTVSNSVTVVVQSLTGRSVT